jgi:hypothetical protein
MSLLKEQNILNTLRENKNLHVFQVITSNPNFQKRFNGDVSLLFKGIKNNLNTFHGISNREYFRGMSGVYYSLEDTDNFEIIIVYDTTIKTLNQIQVITRLRKLLGFDIEVNFGHLEDYEPRILEMTRINRKTQPFGDYYFNTKNLV